MAQTINTNVNSLTAQRNLSRSQGSLATSMQRLSSGLRVNSAKDDAAGLAIAERMDTQVRGMNVAIRNANDGISLAQVAEGGLQEINSMLQRMRELAIQSKNGTNTSSDRDNLHEEFMALNAEIGRIAETTVFNGQSVLRNSGGSVRFQVGANNSTNNELTIRLANFTKIEDATYYSVYTSAGSAFITTTPDSSMSIYQSSPGNSAGIETFDRAADAITRIDAMIDAVTSVRAEFGAIQSRFESAINNLQVGAENQAASRGRIMDADFAVETANMTRAQILQEAGNAMVSQANAQPQSILKLLG